MNELTATQTHLPATVEALNQFIIIGKERLNAQKAKIRAIEKTGMAIEAKEAALFDAQDMADILLDAEMKLGGILNDQTSRGGSMDGKRGSEPSLPPDITHKVSHQAQTLSRNAAVVEQVKAEARDKGFIATADHVYKIIKNPHVFHNSGDNEWYTPGEYIEAARNTMGSIDLDPASSDIANRTVKATKFFKSEEDGRVQEWRGNVFMNPPYAQPLIANFCNTLIKYIHSRTVSQAVVLVNNATETTWFQNLISEASAVCFPEGRVRFLDKDGNPGAPLQGQAVVYFGQNINGFIKQFSHFGVVCNVVER